MIRAKNKSHLSQQLRGTYNCACGRNFRRQGDLIPLPPPPGPAPPPPPPPPPLPPSLPPSHSVQLCLDIAAVDQTIDTLPNLRLNITFQWYLAGSEKAWLYVCGFLVPVWLWVKPQHIPRHIPLIWIYQNKAVHWCVEMWPATTKRLWLWHELITVFIEVV